MSTFNKRFPILYALTLALTLSMLTGCSRDVPVVPTTLPPSPTSTRPVVPTATSTTNLVPESTTGPQPCQQDFEPQEVKDSSPRKSNQPRYTLSHTEFNTALNQMGIETLCIPVEWGLPFIQADWNKTEGTAQSGRMLSLGFNALYGGAGWSDAVIIYATYDFEAGSEYDVFASRDDLALLQSGSMPGTLTVDGVAGFSRPYASLPMGLQWVWQTVVFPFENDYLVIALRLGAYEPAEIEDTLQQIAAGNYPPGTMPDIERLHTLVSSIDFSHPNEFGLGLYLVANETNPRVVDASRLDSIELQQPPVITEQDIVHYDLTTHEIELTDQAFERVMALYTLPVDTDGVPFVVVVSGEPIYSGAFYTPASSLSYNGVVILHPLSGKANTISIQLGYPAREVFDGPDPRSDPRIVNAVQRLQDRSDQDS